MPIKLIGQFLLFLLIFIDFPSSALANENDPEVQFNLGDMYEKGKGISQDKAVAAELYRMAAEQGNVRAQFRLGLMYAAGEGVPEDQVKAAEWSLKAAGQDYGPAQVSTGNHFYFGKGVLKDYNMAEKWYRRAAEKGIHLAQFQLGMMYYEGKGVIRDNEKAFAWFLKAAEQGHADAQFNLGLMYEEGWGVIQDNEKAFGWFLKAAEQGLAGAQFNSGWMYEEGWGVNQDNKKAFEWYLKAAEQGLADAQFNLGLMYLKGSGIPLDKKEAVQWFAKSAHQGYAKAQLNLGVAYNTGQGVRKDKKLATEWFAKSANQGNADAQLALKEMNNGGKELPERDEILPESSRNVTEPGDEPPNGLVCWLPGDSQARDAAGTNHGQLRNGTALATGMVGQGFRFNGSNDYIEIPNSPTLNLGQHTIEAWIRPEVQLGASFHGIVVKQNPDNSGRNYYLGLRSDGRIHYSILFTSGALMTLDSNVTVPKGKWSHIAANFDGSVMNIFCNGALCGNLNVGPATPVKTTQPLLIGHSNELAQTYFRGQLDEVAIYNRALSDKEISTIFNKGGAGKGNPQKWQGIFSQ
jgi:TPR repeat protein